MRCLSLRSLVFLAAALLVLAAGIAAADPSGLPTAPSSGEHSRDRAGRRQGGDARTPSRVRRPRHLRNRRSERSHSGQAQAGDGRERQGRGVDTEAGRRTTEGEAGRRIAQPDFRSAGRPAGADRGREFQGRCSGDVDARRTLRKPGASRRRPPERTVPWCNFTPSSRSSGSK